LTDCGFECGAARSRSGGADTDEAGAAARNQLEATRKPITVTPLVAALRHEPLALSPEGSGPGCPSSSLLRWTNASVSGDAAAASAKSRAKRQSLIHPGATYAAPSMGDREMLEVALKEARSGLGEGGIPIGAALFTADGTLLGRGRNRRVQEQDPSIHGETDAFDAAAAGAPTGTP
jgi:hypothetical protein